MNLSLKQLFRSLGKESTGAKPEKIVRSPRRASGKRSPRFLILGVAALLLSLLGVVMVLSASSVNDLQAHEDAWFHLRRQMIFFVVGLVACLAVMRIDYRLLRNLSGVALGTAGVLLVVVMLPGVGISANGATRWLGVGPLIFQPSEVAKLAVLLFCADFLSRPGYHIDDFKKTVRPLLGLTGLFGFLLMMEPDLGTAIIIATMVASALFFAGLRLRVLAGLGGAGVLTAGVLSMNAGYRRRRLLGVWDPWSDLQNTGWQTIQAGVAVSNGGIFGLGLGASRAKWGFLPFAHTDFIYAIVAEELGLLGAMLVIVLYLVIGFTGLSTAIHAPDAFGQLLAAGVTVWILIQSFVNIGAVLGLLPITGVPLPFVSFGGSALVATMGAYGILLNVARQT
jgi:cell division protein FtsW